MASDRRSRRRKFRQKVISTVDLFCGVGGLTHGFVSEGIRVIAGIDNDPTCRYPYERNNGARFIEKDVRSLTAKELKGLYPVDHVKVLAGCAPCQPFSTYTQRYETDGDSNLDLIGVFGRLVAELKPQIVTMENVCRLSKHVVYETFVQRLKDIGYHVDSRDVECLGFGIPQTRKRLVLLASRYGPIKLIRYTHVPSRYRTVRSVIGKLKRIKAGEVSELDSLHQAAGLSPVNAKRIEASKPGGYWRNWDENLVAECHKEGSGKTYPSVYGRMEWDQPAPTLTTQFYGFGNGRFGHPEQDRGLSLREGALLQTFPRSYKFVKPGEPIYFKRVGRLIGNAIPVRLARAIAKSIKLHVEAYRD